MCMFKRQHNVVYKTESWGSKHDWKIGKLLADLCGYELLHVQFFMNYLKTLGRFFC
jgi:hypothetical protein